ADAAALNAALSADGFAELSVAGETLRVEKDFVELRISAKEGFAAAMENNLFTILDTTITPELLSEGIAREFVSKVQQIRKSMDLAMMDRIRIAYAGDDAVRAAVAAHADYIAKETLARALAEGEADSRWDLNGHDTGIAISKA
ncbi:MAG: DUF5915 domain-containing protein, partial [Clostridiales Family XIII bacterium]|nr:DUF5915 domain-containing protein [Clostridiales Family XIII bacterium]